MTDEDVLGCCEQHGPADALRDTAARLMFGAFITAESHP